MKARLLKYVLASSLIACFCFAVCPQAAARRISVKVDKKALDEQAKVMAAADSVSRQGGTLTLAGDDAAQAVRLYGYDKPHNAAKESMFVSNKLAADTITALQIEVQYYTLDDVKLHTRLVTVPALIPPGESMRLQFPSWDATRTFYYYRTPPTRKEGLNPYKITAVPRQLTLAPTESVSNCFIQPMSVH